MKDVKMYVLTHFGWYAKEFNQFLAHKPRTAAQNFLKATNSHNQQLTNLAQPTTQLIC